jgi:hypothetical protein
MPWSRSCAEEEGRVTYRRADRRTRFFVAVFFTCLFGISWCQEAKR